MTDPDAADRAVREAQQQLADMVQSAPDPIITVSVLGVLQSMNVAAEEASGYRADELVGKHFAQIGLLEAGSLAKALQEFACVIAGQTRPPAEYTIVRKDRTTGIFEANSRPILRGGKITAIHVIFRNVTGRKELEQALTRERDELTRLNKLMLDRESRLLELKQEVNELLLAAGRPPKYRV